jgi:SH3-like domain-containing protein
MAKQGDRTGDRRGGATAVTRSPRATAWLLATVALGLACVSAAENVEFVRVTAEAANVRKLPTRSAQALGQAYEDDPLRVIATRGAWLKVRDFEGREGWIHSRLTDGRSTVIVTAPVANVRSGPGTTHAVTYTAERGVAFRVTGTRGTWLRVTHADGARGWIHRELVWGDVQPTTAVR